MFVFSVLVISGFIDLGIAWTIFRLGNNSPGKNFLSSAILFSGIWTLSIGILLNTRATYTAGLSFASAAVIPFFLILFIIKFTDLNIKDFFIRGLFVIIPCIVFILSFKSGLFYTGISIDSGYIQRTDGSLSYIYNVYFLTYILILATLYILGKRKLYGNKLYQLRIIGLGIGATIFLGTLSNLILPTLGFYSLNNIGPSFTLLMSYSMIYAILKHQLFDIRVVIRKIVVYSTLLAVIFGVYAGFISLMTHYLPINPNIGSFLVAILIAVGFDPLRNWLQATTERYLFVADYNPDVELQKLNQTLTSVVDLDEALRSLMQITTSALRLDRAATLVLTQSGDAAEAESTTAVTGTAGAALADGSSSSAAPAEKTDIRVKRIQEVNFPAPKRLLSTEMTPVLRYFKEQPTIAVVELLHQEVDETLTTYEQMASKVAHDEHQAVAAQNPIFQLKRAAVERLVELKVAVVIPIVVSKKLIGIVFLGNKLSSDSFFEQDLNFLTIVGGQTANAIEKARFFEEDQLKSEFVSIASHELLTPTAAIEGYLSMILEEKMGVVDKKAETYLWTVFQSSKRLSALVKNLLSVSRIESGRIKVEPKIFDLNEVVAQQLDQLQVKATEANLYLKAKYPRHQASVFADPERVTQAVVNMISNGLKYTKQGGVTVAVVEKPRFYEVQVTDTGVGVSEADRQHLFQKFSRIETSATAGIMGTGLGLYITKAIVELMGGSVWVKSTVGQGSTFAFSVPKQKPVKTGN